MEVRDICHGNFKFRDWLNQNHLGLIQGGLTRQGVLDGTRHGSFDVITAL